MLEARQIPSAPDRLWSEVAGDIEAIDGVIRITKIRVKYHLRIPAATREAAERALALHERKCPAATSVRGCIAISYDAEITEGS